MHDKDYYRKLVTDRFLDQRDSKVDRDQKLIKKILKNEAFQQAQVIALYQAFSDEPDLSGMDFGGKMVVEIPQDPDDFVFGLPEDTLFLIPGRAFTSDGKRIGRGGGWYDRSLAKYPKAYKLGVCYDFQVFHDLPQQKWDILMDAVLWE